MQANQQIKLPKKLFKSSRHQLSVRVQARSRMSCIVEMLKSWHFESGIDEIAAVWRKLDHEPVKWHLNSMRYRMQVALSYCFQGLCLHPEHVSPQSVCIFPQEISFQVFHVDVIVRERI